MSGATEETAPERRTKLIEVSLPLEVINRESAREKSIRHGHPSTLHLWWARRPLAAARAMLFAQLVDDPSARPDLYPTEDKQKAARQDLFDLIEKMVPWEATRDERIMREVREKIAESHGDGPLPPILDPFAGGGTIPLEAHRLGLEAHASDLNPVPVVINKALIEIPPRWAGRKPVSPTAELRTDSWPGASGLAEDVRQYGGWMREQARARIGSHYPKAKLEDGSEAAVIAWLWARTVACPNPSCGVEMPLVTTWWLSKKKNRLRWINPVVEGRDVRFEIHDGPEGPPDPPKQGRGAKFTCLVCGDPTPEGYIKAEGMARRMGARLLATVAEGKRQRIYLEATEEHEVAAAVERPADVPEQLLAEDPRNIWCVNYGLSSVDRLFTNRQLLALTMFSDLVGEAHERVERDARDAGMGEAEAAEYGKAVALYLGLASSRTADLNNSIVTWSNSRDQARNLFSRQAIPMAWDFVEVSPFADAAGDLQVSVATAGRVIEVLPTIDASGHVTQADATTRPYDNYVVNTDPPYYDNIGYADLSDFFYVWLRRSLGSIYPEVMSTILTPKEPELIASPYRHGGSKGKAEEHFERGFIETFTRMRAGHHPDCPLVVYYAFKQAENDDEDGTASTGWETMLNGLIQAGWTVTGTWPVRTERAGRSIGIGTNALASSVVLACRPRHVTAGSTDRRGFLRALGSELPDKLRKLQEGNLAPVDLPQSAIGPGIAVFSRYAKVTEPDGTAMRVRTALGLINDVLADVLNEQEGEFDQDTRWAIRWFEQFQWGKGAFGDAETLAKAYNVSVRGLQDAHITGSGNSKVWLVAPADLPESYDPESDARISVWEAAMHLSRVLEGKGAQSGVGPAGELLAGIRRRGEFDEDTIRDLAHLLYSFCERRRWSESGQRFNNLASAWSDLQAEARRAEKRGPRKPEHQPLF